MQQLTAQNDDLSSTVETLKEELIASHEEAERASHELDSIRSRALEENAQESLLRERELRETQTELERCRMEREEWERTALQGRALADDLKSTVEILKREVELEREAREIELTELDSEKEKSNNLQSVLQDFQAGKSLCLCRTVDLVHIVLTFGQPRIMNYDKQSKITTHSLFK